MEVKDCLATLVGALNAHSGLLLKWRVKHLRKTHKKVSKVTKWEKLTKIEDRISFNSSVREALVEDCYLASFCETLVSSGKEVL